MTAITGWKYTVRYSILGVLFGLCFPIISTILALLTNNLGLSLENILRIQRETPLLWVINSAPVFLGIFAGIAGRRQDQIVEINNRLQNSLVEQQQMVINLEVMQKNLERKVESRTVDLNIRKGQLEAAAKIARDAAGIYDLNQLLDKAVNLISQRFGYEHVGLFLLDRTKNYAVLRSASSENGKRMVEKGHKLEVGQKSIVGYVAKTGQPRIALDVGQDSLFYKNPELPDTKSELALPLLLREETIGVLDVQSPSLAAFSQEDLEILQILGDQVALGIGTAKLLAANQESIEALKLSYQELTRDVWTKTFQMYEQVHYLCDADGRVKEARVGENGKTVSPEPDGISLEGAYLSIPIRVREQVIGSVGFQKSQEDPFWSADEISLLETLTSQLSLALDSARLFTESQRRAERERLVADITAKIRSTNEMDKIMNTAVEEIQKALKADQVAFKVKTDEQDWQG